MLYEIHRLACFANEYENDFIKAMVGRSAKVAENDRVRKKRELDGLLARDGELDMLFERLYEDNVSGKIDDARFAKMSKRYEQEQGENAKKIKALRLEPKKLEDSEWMWTPFWKRCAATQTPPPSPSAWLPSSFSTSRSILRSRRTALPISG